MALGEGHQAHGSCDSLDGQSWQPAVAPPELRGKTVVASTMFKGASYVLLSGGESAASSLELLATTDGLSWQRIAPDLMAKAGIWGVGIVSLADQLVVVGATGGNGVGHAEVFTSPDGKTWKSVKNPGLTRKVARR